MFYYAEDKLTNKTMEVTEHSFKDFLITTDKAKMDVVAIHDFLSKYSGWSDNIPFHRVKTSIENSLNFGLFSINLFESP